MDAKGTVHAGTAREALAALETATAVMVRTPWGILPVKKVAVERVLKLSRNAGWEFGWIGWPDGTLQIESLGVPGHAAANARVGVSHPPVETEGRVRDGEEP